VQPAGLPEAEERSRLDVLLEEIPNLKVWIEKSKAIYTRQSVFDLHYILRLIRQPDCAQLRVPNYGMT
jgi:hypothetical protein